MSVLVIENDEPLRLDGVDEAMARLGMQVLDALSIWVSEHVPDATGVWWETLDILGEGGESWQEPGNVHPLINGEPFDLDEVDNGLGEWFNDETVQAVRYMINLGLYSTDDGRAEW